MHLVRNKESSVVTGATKDTESGPQSPYFTSKHFFGPISVERELPTYAENLSISFEGDKVVILKLSRTFSRPLTLS